VTNPKSSTAEKVLSTYLLVEAGARARGELTAMLTTPAEPQDQTLKLMALDGLFLQATQDQTLTPKLADAIGKIPDQAVQKYARQRMKKILQR
jgi:hypothetical protein